MSLEQHAVLLEFLGSQSPIPASGLFVVSFAAASRSPRRLHPRLWLGIARVGPSALLSDGEGSLPVPPSPPSLLRVRSPGLAAQQAPKHAAPRGLDGFDGLDGLDDRRSGASPRNAIEFDRMAAGLSLLLALLGAFRTALLPLARPFSQRSLLSQPFFFFVFFALSLVSTATPLRSVARASPSQSSRRERRFPV